MVSPHDRYNGIRKSHSLQNFSPDHGVDLHLLEFFRRQSSGFGNDVLRHREFANVVQQRGSVEGFHFSGSYGQLFCHFDGIDSHSLQVVVGGVILGFDG